MIIIEINEFICLNSSINFDKNYKTVKKNLNLVISVLI